MKRSFTILMLAVICLTAMASTNSFDAVCTTAVTQVNAQSSDEGWILIGEITLSNYNNSSETILADLYVREVGASLIYRVEYKGLFYATRWHEYSQTYHVSINGTTYRCDVPAVSNGTQSDSKTSLQRFVGVWKPMGSSLAGDVRISIQNNKLLVQMKTGDNQSLFASSEATVSGDVIHWSCSMEDYGDWWLGYTSGSRCYLLGDGYSSDPDDSVWVERRTQSSRANREVTKFFFTARLKDGNLEISEEIQDYYYWDSDSKYFEAWKTAPTELGSVTYTQW